MCAFYSQCHYYIVMYEKGYPGRGRCLQLRLNDNPSRPHNIHIPTFLIPTLFPHTPPPPPIQEVKLSRGDQTIPCVS